MKARLLSIPAMVLCLSWAAPAADFTDDDCLDCHSEPGLKTRFKDGTSVALTIDGTRFRKSAHGQLTCADCHTAIDIDDHPDRELVDRRQYAADLSRVCADCHEEEASQFTGDLHASARGPLYCTDCHDPHATDASGVGREKVIATCGRCHADTYDRYAKSAHGGAVLSQRNLDVPVCTDCHRAHRIERADTPAFHVASVDLCRRCHGDAAKMARYGLSTAVLDTYLQDFHGVSVTYRRKEGTRAAGNLQATCIDCHGAHAIAKRGTSASLEMKANLARMCARCHPGASESFTRAWLSHYIPSPRRAPLVYFVRAGYSVFIPFMVIGLMAHIGLDLERHRRHRTPRSARSVVTRAGDGSRVRFTRFRRAEHLAVMVTFTLLVVTGLPQKFHDTGWGERMILTLGGMEATRLVHRVAGVAFTVLAAVHLGGNLLGILRGKMRPSMLLGRQDFRDTIQSVRHSLGRVPSPPRFDRFDFRQKFEYWGIIMGGTVMIVTGFILIFPMLFAAYFPGQLIPAAKTAHSFEALLALLVIIVWHVYCAFLSPEVFPLDRTIFTGRITRERMEEEHPLELERLDREQ
ncbi:MAG: cytochrome c3 family protein [Acidobacteriota bacterium]